MRTDPTAGFLGVDTVLAQTSGDGLAVYIMIGNCSQMRVLLTGHKQLAVQGFKAVR